MIPGNGRQGLVVLLLAAVSVAVLAGVQARLSPRIDRNRLDETMRFVPRLVPDAVRGEPCQAAGETVYRALGERGDQFGWVIVGRGQGFNGDLTVLIGLNNKADTITGLHVIERANTPGPGDKTAPVWWREQFDGLDPARPVTVTRASPRADANEVRPVSGATVASKEICTIVNETAARLHAHLAGMVKTEPRP